jgi:hypothetical protein
MLNYRDNLRPATHQQQPPGDDDMPNFTDAVKRFALANYEIDGWDYVIECYSDAEIFEIIRNCRTENGAIRAMRAQIKPRADYRAEIQSTAF